MKLDLVDQWNIMSNLGDEADRLFGWRYRFDTRAFNTWCDEHYGCQPFPKKDKTGDLLVTDEKKFLFCVLKHNHPNP